MRASSPRSVQPRQASLGYQHGAASTGGPTEETAKAIREFEMDKGLVPTRSRVSAELVTPSTIRPATKPSNR